MASRVPSRVAKERFYDLCRMYISKPEVNSTFPRSRY